MNDLTPEIAKSINVSPDLKAPFVINANPGEPAEKGGIKNYDVIVEFNGKAIHSGADLITAVTAADVGKSVPVKVLRSGETKNLSIKIGQRPGAQEVAEHVGKKKEKRHNAKQVETGMDIDNLTPDIAHELGMPDLNKGVVVANVTYGGPADRAGLSRGDVILEVDRKPISDVDGFYKAVKEKKNYLLRIRRADPQTGASIYSVVVLNLAAKD